MVRMRTVPRHGWRNNVAPRGRNTGPTLLPSTGRILPTRNINRRRRHVAAVIIGHWWWWSVTVAIVVAGGAGIGAAGWSGVIGWRGHAGAAVASVAARGVVTIGWWKTPKATNPVHVPRKAIEGHGFPIGNVLSAQTVIPCQNGMLDILFARTLLLGPLGKACRLGGG